MTDLISRLEALTAPSRELDEEIALANGWTRIPHSSGHVSGWCCPDGQICANAPHFTSSIDAALTLVPKGWHAVVNHRDNLDGSSSVILHKFALPYRRVPSDAPFAIVANKAAIALVIACLKAKERI